MMYWIIVVILLGMAYPFYFLSTYVAKSRYSALFFTGLMLFAFFGILERIFNFIL